MKSKMIATEIYSRVSGYFRPVKQWNKAKREEFSDRKKLKFDTEEISASEAELTEAR